MAYCQNTMLCEGVAIPVSLELAQITGVHESLLLQQVHYWINKSGKYIDGKYWIYNSYNDWHKQLKCLSCNQIRRAFESLEKKGLIISKKMKSSRFNHTKWYTIDYDKVKAIVPSAGIADIKRSNNTFSEIDLSQEEEQAIVVAEYRKSLEDKKASEVEEKQKNLPISPVPHRFGNNARSLQEKNLNSIKDISSNRVGDGEQKQNTVLDTKQIEEIKSIWKKYFSKPLSLTDKQQKMIEFVWEEYFDSSVDKWKEYCELIASSKFLMGEKTSFKANISFLLKPETIGNIRAGEYSTGDRNIKPDVSESIEEKRTRQDRELEEMDLPIKKQLLEHYGKDTCSSWFSRLRVEKVEEGIVTLSTPSAFIAEYIEENFKDKMLELWSGNKNKTKNIKFLS